MATPIDDPDERRFQQFAEQTGRNVTDASEAVRELDERIGAIKADCQETEHKLRNLEDGDERSWLIYRLQRQRLLYARYHVRKIAILKKLADFGTLRLPGEEMDEISREARDLRQMTTEDVRLMEDHLRRHSRDLGHEHVHHTHGHPHHAHAHEHAHHHHSTAADAEAKRETWRAYFNALFDRLYGARHAEEDEATRQRNCDTIEAARRFYSDQFVRGFEPMSDDHEEDARVTSKETILFGGRAADGAAGGSSANATIERRDHYRDQRQVTDEWIRYVHEHVRSYRLEAILHRDQASEIAAELRRLYEQDADLFRQHFGDEQPWKHFEHEPHQHREPHHRHEPHHHHHPPPFDHHHRHGGGGKDESDDEDGHDHRGDDVETIRIVPLDTRPTTAASRDETASISVSLTSRDESAIFEEDEGGQTTPHYSDGTTPTPTRELGQRVEESGRLLLRSDEFQQTPFVVQFGQSVTRVYEGGRTDFTYDVEEEIHRTSRRLPKEEEAGHLLLYEGDMREVPLVITLDRYPFEWYYEVLERPRHRHLPRPALPQGAAAGAQVVTEVVDLGQPQKVLEHPPLGRSTEFDRPLGQEQQSFGEPQPFGQQQSFGQPSPEPKPLGQPQAFDHPPLGQSTDFDRPLGQQQAFDQPPIEQKPRGEPQLLGQPQSFDHPPLGQPAPEQSTRVLWRQGELPYAKLDEQKRISETGTIVFSTEIEETIERTPPVRRRPVQPLEDRPLSEEVGEPLGQSVVQPLGQGVSEPLGQSVEQPRAPYHPFGQSVEQPAVVYEKLEYNAFVERPLIISLDAYPREWYYEVLEEPIVVRDEYGREVHETRTDYTVEEEVTIERSPKTRRRQPQDEGAGGLGQSVRDEEVLHYRELAPHPLERFPHETEQRQAEAEPPLRWEPLERRQVVEEGVARYDVEFEETSERSPAIRRHIEELDELVQSPVELKHFEERLVFHLLNYQQDMPTLPFHIRRRWRHDDVVAPRPPPPVQPLGQPPPIERIVEEVKNLLLRESELLHSPLAFERREPPVWYDRPPSPASVEEEPVRHVHPEPPVRPAEEAGRLILRDAEFGQHPLDRYLSQRPATFEWIPMAEEAPIGHVHVEPVPATIGHVVYRPRPQSYTPEAALHLLEPLHDLPHSFYAPVIECRSVPVVVESGRLLLRDEEFGPWPLEHHVHTRLPHYHYDLLHHHHHPVEPHHHHPVEPHYHEPLEHHHVHEYPFHEVPLDQPLSTLAYREHGHVVWRIERPLDPVQPVKREVEEWTTDVHVLEPQPAPRHVYREPPVVEVHHLHYHEMAAHPFEYEPVHHRHHHPSHHYEEPPHYEPIHEHEHRHHHPHHEPIHVHEHEHRHPPHYEEPPHYEPIHEPAHVHVHEHEHRHPHHHHAHYEEPPAHEHEHRHPPPHYEKPPVDEWYGTASTDFPTWGQRFEHEFDLVYRPDFHGHPWVVEKRESIHEGHHLDLPVEPIGRGRSETTRTEDYLILRREDIEHLPYEHVRPPSLSYVDIGETRSRRTSTATTETGDYQLLWRKREFRASLYEPQRRPVVVTRRETDPIVRRREPTVSSLDTAEVQELRHSRSELGHSTPSLASDTTASVYDQHLHRMLEMPYATLVTAPIGLGQPPPPLSMPPFEEEVRERGVPPRRPLEPIPSVPTPLTSPLEKEAQLFLQPEEEMHQSEWHPHVHHHEPHLHHHEPIYDEHVHVHVHEHPPPPTDYLPLVFGQSIRKLYREREFHGEPLEHPIYDVPPAVAEREEEFERVMREPHVHPHLEPLPADVNEALRIDLPHERFEPIVTDEPLPTRPMDLPRRLTDEGLELLLYRTPEMDELLFDEIWHLLDSGRYRPRRLSEIQEERMSFGPESNANSKSSSDDRAAVGTTEYNELPQLKFDQYGKPPPVPSGSPGSQALSPDYPQPAPGYPSTYNEYFLYYTTDVEHIPLLVEHVKLIRRDHEEPPVGPPPPPPHDHEHDLAGHSDFSDSDVDELSPKEELKQTEFQRVIYERPPIERHEPEPIYAEITHRPPPPPVAQETPPAFPKTPPPQRRPLDSLDRIYEAPYEPIAVRRQPPDLPPPHPHVHHPPHEERRPAPIVRPLEVREDVVESPTTSAPPPTPAYEFPNVKKMAEAYAREHERGRAPVTPAPRLHRLWPHQEIPYLRFEAVHVAPPRVVDREEPVRHVHPHVHHHEHEHRHEHEPHVHRHEHPPHEHRHEHPPHHHHRHPRRNTIEFETASDFERSPVPVRAADRFRHHGHFADEVHAVTESQLATPTESPVPSPAPSVGRLKRFSEQFESPIPPSPLAKEPAARVQKPAPAPAVQRERPAPLRPAPAPHFRRRIDEIVRIGGEEFGVVERVGGGEGTYSVEKHSDLRRLLADHQVEDAWIDRYLRSHRRWEIPVFLVPGGHSHLRVPLRPTARRRISLGVLLRRTRLSASAPGGLDHLHIHEAIHQHHKHPHLHHDEQLHHHHRHVSPPVVPASHHTPSESSSWSVQSPTRSRSSPFVHRQWRAEEDEGNELLRNPAFIRAREHSDAFAWGSIHRKRGREVAAELQRLDSESGSKTAEEEPAVVSPPPPAHSHGGSSAARSPPVEREERRSYHHEYDAVYEDPHGHVVQHRHTHDHGYSHRSGPPEEPVPVPVRRLGQQPPPLPSTPPPKTPPAFGQEVREERPISLAERLLTKTPSFERRQRHPSARDTPTEPPKEQPAEQRLSPFGARRSFTAERKKWVDEEEAAEDEEKTEVASLNEEAEDLRRTVHGLRHVELPEERAERESAAVSDEEQENRAQFARPHLRHVESASLRRKRRLDHDPYIRHPTEPDFEPGLHFPKRRFLTYLLRAPPFRGRPRYYNRMPDLTDGLQFMNGAPIHDELLEAIDNEQTAHVDPTALLQKMYTIDYNPLIETRTRFRSMEGHMEIPNEGHELVEPVEKPWKSLYFRIRDGRFQWFATHGADECPMGDVLLVDTKITASTSDWTFKVEGGKENANLYVRAPSNVFEKWRIALLSNSASQLIDAYVHPVRPVVPHYTQKVAFIEIGTCSVRAGIQTNKPSLPQSFFPAVACISDDSNELTVGIDALRPDVRRRGRLHRPLEDGDGTTAERVRLNQRVVEACVRKAVDDLKLQPNNFKVLLSVAQDVPATHVPALLRLLIETVGFQAATIARQPSLILFSYDVTTGVVVDLGERLHVVPVIDEYIVDSAVVSLPFGAPQIRAALRRKLENGETASLVGNQSVVAHLALREAVKQACFVSADGSSASGKSATVDLNDTLGKRFTVDEIRQEATEGLFDPQRWGLELKGLHKIIHDVIQQSPIDSRRTLYRNIYLSGGTSLLPGLAERLELEVGKVAPPSIFVQVHGSPWRYNASYLGAQVLANTHPFEECFADKSNLDEYIKQIETEIN